MFNGIRNINFINIVWIKQFLKGMRYSKMDYFTGFIFPWWIQYITRFISLISVLC